MKIVPGYENRTWVWKSYKVYTLYFYIFPYLTGEYTGARFEGPKSGQGSTGNPASGSLEEMERKFQHMVSNSRVSKVQNTGCSNAIYNDGYKKLGKLPCQGITRVLRI
jgi:hypothetical protein